MRGLRFLILIILALALVGWAANPKTILAEGETPSTIFLPLILSGSAATQPPPQPSFISLEDFSTTVQDGRAGIIRGAYVEDVLALKVEQQPNNNYDFIYSLNQTATQYMLAASLNVTGLLAHNSLAGNLFFNLQPGQTVVIIYGDGSQKAYQIERITRYQAVNPSSSSSDLIDLETGKQYTAGQIFNKHYMGNHHVTFQTCITQNGSNNWGRIFIEAQPVN